MLTELQRDSLNEHRVEVSGWDRDEAFFVEKTQFLPNGCHGERIRLRHALRDLAVIFIRVLHTRVPSRVCPVAYQVKVFFESGNTKAHEYNLTRLHPKGAYDEKSVDRKG